MQNIYKDGQKVWGDVLSTLKTQVSSSNFKTWFSGSYVLDFKKNEGSNLLIVAVRNNFLKEQIENRFYSSISQIVKEKGLDDLSVIFVVSQKEQRVETETSPLFSGVAQQFMLTKKSFDTLSTNHTFKNFVVGSANNLAYLAASQVTSNLGTLYNPLLVYGQTGVGKTHLLQAIGNEVLARTVDAKVLYVTSEGFTNDYLESLGNRTQAAFRQKYRSPHLLIVDDIQFLAGKESTQDEFFHTFNELVLSGRQVVVACDRHPKELGRLKERLVSRFLGGMVVDIGLPDLETKMLIVKTKCAERGINLDLQVVEYIARECRGGARELEGVLTNVLANIRLAGGKMSPEDILAAVDKSKNTEVVRVSPKEVVSAVSKHFKVSVEDLRGASRRSSLVFARQIAMYLLRKDLNVPLEQIGDLLGGRDHSTVIYGVGKMENAVKQSSSLRDQILRVESFFNK